MAALFLLAASLLLGAGEASSPPHPDSAHATVLAGPVVTAAAPERTPAKRGADPREDDEPEAGPPAAAEETAQAVASGAMVRPAAPRAAEPLKGPNARGPPGRA